MITLTFLEFYKGDYEDVGYSLYFVRGADGQALYIGISANSIWQRWFGGGTGHMTIGFDGKLHGASHIGQVIENNLPLSWEWKIDLLKVEDCERILAEGHNGEDLTRRNIGLLEVDMITRFSP
jgi:hypothetical protein